MNFCSVNNGYLDSARFGLLMTVPRLNRDILKTLESHTLSYEWPEPEIGIVHLGLGNFHRAHQALYTEESLVKSGGDWAICGVTLQGSTVKRDILNDQDGLYSLINRGSSNQKVLVIRVLREVLSLPHDWASLHTRLSDSNVKIVSLTVTEKGYCRKLNCGNLKMDHPLILHDLEHPATPRSVPGILLAGLHTRMKRNLKPFTVLSCDNLEKNGAAVRQTVLDLACLVEQKYHEYHGLSSWILEECKFPSTMVDRIVPATTDEDAQFVHNVLHIDDLLPLSCEPFRQWVIEDTFVDGRPEWEKVGVQLVSDVAPYEVAKLCMLNAAHSTLAYISLLLDIKTIDEAISQEVLRSFLYDMITDEVIPAIRPSMPANFDLCLYRDEIFARFANPALKHRTAQIAADGSQKIPQRLFGTLAKCDQQKLPYHRLALAIAAWFTFLRGYSDQDVSYDIQDPLSEQLRGIHRAHGARPAEFLQAMCVQTQILPESLQKSASFQRSMRDAITSMSQGALSAIRSIKHL